MYRDAHKVIHTPARKPSVHPAAACGRLGRRPALASVPSVSQPLSRVPSDASPPAATDGGAIVSVAVQTPAHSAVGGPLSYASAHPLEPGTLVRVPLGTREVLGVVWDAPADAPELPRGAAVRPVAGVLEGLAPLDAAWRRLVAFAARYYQRALGEVALAALPPQLRDLTPAQLARRLRRAPAATAGGSRAALCTRAPRPERRTAGGHGRHRRPARTLPALRQHGQRQDRGVPALRAAGPGRGSLPPRCW